MDSPDRPGLTVIDEMRHRTDGQPGWREEWAFWFWSADGSVGGYTGLTVVGNGNETWYWAALVRPGEPLLHVCDVSGPALRPSSSLLLKSIGLWADHDCEVPFEQWTVANECFAVALDDPDDVFGRAYGVSTPIAFDLEWYATSPTEPIVAGYRQQGEVHAVIEIPGEPITGEFLSYRTHRWGHWEWGGDPLASDGRRAPLAVHGQRVERVLTGDGWCEALRP